MKAKVHNYKPIAQMTRAQIIDELGPLEERYEGDKPYLDRREALCTAIRGGGEKKLTGWAETDKKASAEPVQYDGAVYQVQLSKCADASRIPSLLKIWQAVGSIRFLHVCTLTLKAARELIPTADADGYIVTEPNSGARKITAVVTRDATREAQRAA